MGLPPERMLVGPIVSVPVPITVIRIPVPVTPLKLEFLRKNKCCFIADCSCHLAHSAAGKAWLTQVFLLLI